MDNRDRLPPNMSPEKYQRLRAEAQAPYKGLRKFVYGTFAARYRPAQSLTPSWRGGANGVSLSSRKP